MNDSEVRAWDDRYRAAGLVWGAGPNQFLVTEVADLEPGSALDVACGEGRNAIWLAEHGWRVVGVDFSGQGLQKARSLSEQRGAAVQWVEADVRAWSPAETFDLVIVMYLHLPADIRHDVFSRMAASVAPGGTMLVVGHDISNLVNGHGGPQNPEVLYGPEDVAADLDGSLTIQRAERLDRSVITELGTATAIDVLVRGHRSTGASDHRALSLRP